MGDKHRKDRYGETWDQGRIDICLHELQALRHHVILSGGWAWHFMSKPGHTEYKHAHDHKDIDIYVPRDEVPNVIAILEERDFYRSRTQWDNNPQSKAAGFRRYEKMVEGVKVTLDFFVVPAEGLPTREINGWTVVEPKHLLSLYKSIHSSDQCFAVLAAHALVTAGMDPVGHLSLSEIPRA